MWASPSGIEPRISICETGLCLGAGTQLAPFAGATNRLAVDDERLEALFAVAFQHAPSIRHLSAIEAASSHWQRCDKARANLRLVFADLPRLEAPEDAVRLKAAELLFDAGLRAKHLATIFETDPSFEDLEKYDPDQPRVPAEWDRKNTFVAWVPAQKDRHSLISPRKLRTALQCVFKPSTH